MVHSCGIFVFILFSRGFFCLFTLLRLSSWILASRSGMQFLIQGCFSFCLACFFFESVWILIRVFFFLPYPFCFFFCVKVFIGKPLDCPPHCVSSVSFLQGLEIFVFFFCPVVFFFSFFGRSLFYPLPHPLPLFILFPLPFCRPSFPSILKSYHFFPFFLTTCPTYCFNSSCIAFLSRFGNMITQVPFYIFSSLHSAKGPGFCFLPSLLTASHVSFSPLFYCMPHSLLFGPRGNFTLVSPSHFPFQLRALQTVSPPRSLSSSLRYVAKTQMPYTSVHLLVFSLLLSFSSLLSCFFYSFLLIPILIFPEFSLFLPVFFSYKRCFSLCLFCVLVPLPQVFF